MRGMSKFGVVAPGLMLALLLVACASNGSVSSGSSGSPSSTSSAMGKTISIKTASVGAVGTVVVDDSGRTLYSLSADKGGKVTCTSSACVGVWPPLLLRSGESAVAGSGIDSSKLGTVKTPSGATQVTYNHWPLYMYSGDSAAGQANGQGINSFGGVWHPMAPSGQAITGSSRSGTSTGGGG